MRTFGESAPAKQVYEHFGITAERVATLAPGDPSNVRMEIEHEQHDNQVNPRLKALTKAGVSVWLDQISRSLIAERRARAAW